MKPSTFKSLTAVAMLVAAMPFPSFAQRSGGADTGGGDAVTSPTGQRSLLDLVEKDSDLQPFVFEAAKYEDRFGYLIDRIGQGDTLNIGSVLDLIPRSVMSPLSFCLHESAGLRWAFTKAPLEEIRDEGIVRYSNIGSKHQLAIQKDNLVLVNSDEFAALDDMSKAALKFHEGLFCAAKVFNPYLHSQKGTEVIRKVVRTAVQAISTRGPSYPFTDALKELNAIESTTVTLTKTLPKDIYASIPITNDFRNTIVLHDARRSKEICIEFEPEENEFRQSIGSGCTFDKLTKAETVQMKQIYLKYKKPLVAERKRILELIEIRQKAGVSPGY
jgi:hypothetical protein